MDIVALLHTTHQVQGSLVTSPDQLSNLYPHQLAIDHTNVTVYDRQVNSVHLTKNQTSNRVVTHTGKGELHEIHANDVSDLTRSSTPISSLGQICAPPRMATSNAWVGDIASAPKKARCINSALRASRRRCDELLAALPSTPKPILNQPSRQHRHHVAHGGGRVHVQAGAVADAGACPFDDRLLSIVKHCGMGIPHIGTHPTQLLARSTQHMPNFSST